MDKRWIGIIIILIAGLCAMFYITVISDSVGNALTTIDDVSVTLPINYKIDSTQNGQAKLIDPENNHTIVLKCLGDLNLTSKSLEKDLKSINKKGDLEVTKKTNDTIQYKNITSGKDTTIMYIENSNHTISMKFSNFDNQKDIDNDAEFIIKNLKHDYKQL